MGNTFNPGAGWFEVDEAFGLASEQRQVLRWDDGNLIRWWVHEKPMPSLPAVPYTVIQVTWSESRGQNYLVLAGTSHKWVQPVSGVDYDEADLTSAIDTFRVITEPPAVTARAVLDRVRHFVATGDTHVGWLAELHDEFEVI